MSIDYIGMAEKSLNPFFFGSKDGMDQIISKWADFFEKEKVVEQSKADKYVELTFHRRDPDMLRLRDISSELVFVQKWTQSIEEELVKNGWTRPN